MPAQVIDSIHAWAVSDGRAGNARQAEALLAAMATLLAPGGPQIEPGNQHLQTRAPWRWVAPHALPGSDHAFGPAFQASLALPPRIAIGCGRQAALATRVLRARGTRVVQILDPRIDPAHWDIVVAPTHDGLQGANVLACNGSLHPVDDAWLAAGRHAFPAFEALPRPRTAVLVGGPGPHARFDVDGLASGFAAIAASLAREGGSVLATPSRRTPQATARALRTAFADTPGLVWTADEAAPNPYAGLLGWADRIVCTADSVNMLSEAAATRVPVWVLDAAAVHGPPRQFVDALLASGRIATLDFASPAGASMSGVPAIPAWTLQSHPDAIEPLRETARVAALVVARLRLR